MGRCLFGFLLLIATGCSAGAETLRIATWDPELTRKGPGLLLRDLMRDDDPQIAAAVAVIAEVSPDILLLTGFDWDYQGIALNRFVARLADAGVHYGYVHAPRPNTGMATGLDIDGNGRTGDARDAQGYGRFNGESGMALLSRLPPVTPEIRDFSDFLWQDLPDALIDGAELSSDARAIQRLSTTGHWDVPVRTLSGTRLSLRAFAATPPVFDGPEDRNGRRNHDETAFWLRYAEGRLPVKPAPGPFVVLGSIDLDPVDGEGRRGALDALLARLGDTRPRGAGGQAAANPGHRGDPALDTAEYGDPPGNLRVDYVLPSPDLTVTGAGVWWPLGPAQETARQASRHRLVWVDISLP